MSGKRNHIFRKRNRFLGTGKLFLGQKPYVGETRKKDKSRNRKIILGKGTNTWKVTVFLGKGKIWER